MYALKLKRQSVVILSQLLLSSLLLPVLIYLISNLILRGNAISPVSTVILSFYATLLAASHVAGMKMMSRHPLSFTIFILASIAADGAVMLAGMNVYGTQIVDFLFKL
ncbi:hypothetical protein PCCS19_12000 [Paenibacillus sp. CCS19]|uniref:hypothetical protein n=1 Tax=Paenibacillus sp. CCS19 TaxID=3158387 RepID=UPI00255FA4DC|nr:hypothetical protein [Paenibacillus cellulosilyticus]GMK38146.1 hypothetical protein PCCS19_12000 [Paenibacillus cellulosilyticus]